jgi:hypothetical protein
MFLKQRTFQQMENKNLRSSHFVYTLALIHSLPVLILISCNCFRPPSLRLPGVQAA